MHGGLGGCCHLLVPSPVCKLLSLSKSYLHILNKAIFIQLFALLKEPQCIYHYALLLCMSCTISGWIHFSAKARFHITPKNTIGKQWSLFASWTQQISVSSPISKNWLSKGLNYGLQIFSLSCLNKTSYAVLHFPQQFNKMKVHKTTEKVSPGLQGVNPSL